LQKKKEKKKKETSFFCSKSSASFRRANNNTPDLTHKKNAMRITFGLTNFQLGALSTYTRSVPKCVVFVSQETTLIKYILKNINIYGT